MKNETLTAILNEKDKLSAYMGVGVDYYKGETGKSGADEVYIGPEPPTDPQVKLWVDTEAQSVGAVDWDDVGNKPNFATVAESGSYNDLTDKPVIPEAPDLTPYAKTADLSTVATSGSYEDLTNKPNLFSGSYNDLTDKPVIPEPYTLPTASTDILGGVKVDGETITIADGVISSAGGGGTDLSNTLLINSTKSNDIDTPNVTDTLIFGSNNQIGDTYSHRETVRSAIVAGYQNWLYTTTLYSLVMGSNNTLQGRSHGSLIVAGNNNSTYSMRPITATIIVGNNNNLSSYTDNISQVNVCGFGNGLELYHNNFVIGNYNIKDSDSNYRLIIGNGSGNDARANALTVSTTGNLAIAGTMSSAGADYAEFFEWKDGNPEAEDRVGYIVALDGDKIILANEGDYILGVVSGTATVLGDNPEWNWAKRWITDDFGRIQYEDKVIHHEAENDRPAWDETIKAPVVNPDYDPDQKYIKRADRPEWSAVGMMGKLYVRDDGTCQVNGFAKPINGVATASTSGTMRVIERVSDNVIRVVIK